MWDFNGDPLDPSAAAASGTFDDDPLGLNAGLPMRGAGLASSGSSGGVSFSFAMSSTSVDAKLCGVNGCPLAKNHPGLCAIEAPVEPRSRKPAVAPAPPVVAPSLPAGKQPAAGGAPPPKRMKQVASKSTGFSIGGGSSASTGPSAAAMAGGSAARASTPNVHPKSSGTASGSKAASLASQACTRDGEWKRRVRGGRESHGRPSWTTARWVDPAHFHDAPLPTIIDSAVASATDSPSSARPAIYGHPSPRSECPCCK